MLKNIFKSTKTWRPQYHVSPGSPSPLYMGFCTRPVACSRYISLQTTLVILQTMAKSITITDYFFTSVSLIIKDNIKQNSHYTSKVQNQSLLITYSDNEKMKGTTLIICYLFYYYLILLFLFFADIKIWKFCECKVDRKIKYLRNSTFLAFEKI